MNAQLPHRAFMAALAATASATSALEVGVADGASALAIVAGAGAGLADLALCDTWGPAHGGTNRGSHAHVAEALVGAGYAGRVRWIDGPSALVDLLPEACRYDLTHVDGDHSEFAALADLRRCWRRTRVAMAVHDIFMPPVWAAVSQWLVEARAEVVRAELSVADTGTLVAWRAAR